MILIFKKIFCFLKMKSVENILMCLRGQFSRFLRGNSFNKIFEIVRNVRSYFILRQQKIKLKTVLSGETRALCKRMFCCIWGQYFYIEITLFAALSNLHLLSISFSLRHERTVTRHTVDVQSCAY